MSAGCIRRYLVELLGPAAEGKIHGLYGAKLTKAVRRHPKLKKDKLVLQLAALYERLYNDSTPLDVAAHPDTGKPCSVDQKNEVLATWLES